MKNADAENSQISQEELERVMARARAARYRGQLAGAQVCSSATLPSCGDRVMYRAVIAEGQIAQIRFEASGCMLSQVAADVVAELLEGVAVSDCSHRLSEAQVLTRIGLPLGPNRRACALLAVAAARELCIKLFASGSSVP